MDQDNSQNNINDSYQKEQVIEELREEKKALHATIAEIEDEKSKISNAKD